MAKSEIQERARFEKIRYAQCWEDPALLGEALEPAGKRLLSIGSAGDNSFALLAAGARRVTAVEMNPAQVACIELRKGAYLRLGHGEFLELLGVRESGEREKLFRAVRELLPEGARGFWEGNGEAIRRGVVHAGKFENYFRLFRERALPWAHSRRRVEELLEPRGRAEREDFYERVWNNRRWRWLFGLFFSRRVMGWLGRDPAFFDYVEGSVAERILERVRHALVELEPARNPWLRFILTGGFGEDLPPALQEGNFGKIREALEAGRLEVEGCSLEEHLGEGGEDYGGFNLSDIFEYMSEANAAALMRRVGERAAPGARAAYWNMLAPRSRPEELAGMWRTVEQDLLERDRCFFYSRFVVEERG